MSLSFGRAVNAGFLDLFFVSHSLHKGLPFGLGSFHIFFTTEETPYLVSKWLEEVVKPANTRQQYHVTARYATPSMKMMQEAMGGSIGGMPEEEPLWTDNKDELARICGLR